MADLPGWTWAPGQWAREPDGCTVLVDGVDEHGRPMAGGVALADVMPDGDGVGMGEWALRQVPRLGRLWTSPTSPTDERWVVLPDDWRGIESAGRGPTLYAACEAVARSRGGWGR